jgi:FlaA1/EpsC-like NDP-sugar epimerase
MLMQDHSPHYFCRLAPLDETEVFSYVLRLETFSVNELGSGFLFFTGVVIVIIPLLFYLFGIYSRYWIYASVEELLLLSGATTLGAAISGTVSLVAAWIIPDMMVPRSIPFIFWPLALLVTGGAALCGAVVCSVCAAPS